MEVVEEASRHIVRRGLDEPKLKIGDTILIKAGVTGIVLARYTPSGARHQICYIVEEIAGSEKQKPRSK